MAEKVRKALDLLDVPFPVEDAIARLGGTVEGMTADQGEALIRKSGDAFVIQIAELPERRRRFSLAHELGHLFLHMGFIIDPSRWESIDQYRDSPKHRYGFSEEEYEAHEFAAALLMPETEFRSAVRTHTADGRTDLKPVADHFEVSVHAARTRGQWLGIFEWGQ